MAGIFLPGSSKGASGDITGVTAGVGLSGGGDSDDVTLTLDLSELSTVTPINGDFFATLDSDGATEQKTSTTALATLFAGDGLTASSAVLAVNVDDSTIETDSDAIRIKDNGVSLAKMAGLTRGSIIYGDTSGDPAALAKGSANYVLTSDGTDIAWASASAGAVTALNSATENEIVTVGSTTTELDAESMSTAPSTTKLRFAAAAAVSTVVIFKTPFVAAAMVAVSFVLGVITTESSDITVVPVVIEPANVALKSSLNVSAVAREFKEEPLPEAFAV